MSEGVQAVLIILTVFIAIGGIAFIIFSIDKNNEERKKLYVKTLQKIIKDSLIRKHIRSLLVLIKRLKVFLFFKKQIMENF